MALNVKAPLCRDSILLEIREVCLHFEGPTSAPFDHPHLSQRYQTRRGEMEYSTSPLEFSDSLSGTPRRYWLSKENHPRAVLRQSGSAIRRTAQP